MSNYLTPLFQDNRTLKEQNDELNGQIINLSIQGAKNLMSASFSDSLAAEINSVSRVEVQNQNRSIQRSPHHVLTDFCSFCFLADGNRSQTRRDQLQTAGLHWQNHRCHHGVQPFHPGGQINDMQPKGPLQWFHWLFRAYPGDTARRNKRM